MPQCMPSRCDTREEQSERIAMALVFVGMGGYIMTLARD
jgi:hypothetical protein